MKIEKFYKSTLKTKDGDIHEVKIPAMYDSLKAFSKYSDGYETKGKEDILLSKILVKNDLYNSKFLGEIFELNTIFFAVHNGYTYAYELSTRIKFLEFQRPNWSKEDDEYMAFSSLQAEIPAYTTISIKMLE